VSVCPLLSSTVCPWSVSISHCKFRLLVLCQCVHYCLLQAVHYLSVTHTVSIVCWLCVTFPTAVFYSPSSVSTSHCKYHLLVVCHYALYCLLKSVHCLSVPYTLLSLGSVSLYPLLSTTVCQLSVCLSEHHTVSTVCSFCVSVSTTVHPLSVSTSHCWLCVTLSTTVFYSQSSVCQYLTL